MFSHRAYATTGFLILSAALVGGCAKEWWRSAETDVCESGPRISAYHSSVYENTGVMSQLGDFDSDVILQAYEKAGHDPDALWQETTVPRVYAATMPRDMADAATSEERRKVFVAVTLPLVLRINEVIADRRAVVKAANDCVDQGRALGPDLKSQLAWLNHHYGAGGDLKELLARVDGVPPSLALAQAALGSGWGTSQSVQVDHALFDLQKGDGPDDGRLKPVDLRGPEKAEMARRYEHLIHSVYAYMHELNTEPGFAGFRARRADLGGVDGEAIGTLLAPTLSPYSGRSGDYVRDVEDLIRFNEFQTFDDMHLVKTDHDERFWNVENG